MSDLDYYVAYDGYNYIDTFPQEWLLCQDDDLTGPLHCGNCENYGSIFQNGVHIFMGYCSNCALYIYMEKRGDGFYGFDNTYLVEHYVYPDYLLKYKDNIIDLVQKQFDSSHLRFHELCTTSQCQSEENDVTSLSDHTTEPPSPKSHDTCVPLDNSGNLYYDNKCEYKYECEKPYDVEIELSEKESEIYSDSDDDLFYV